MIAQNHTSHQQTNLQNKKDSNFNPNKPIDIQKPHPKLPKPKINKALTHQDFPFFLVYLGPAYQKLKCQLEVDKFLDFSADYETRLLHRDRESEKPQWVALFRIGKRDRDGLCTKFSHQYSLDILFIFLIAKGNMDRGEI
ncbi:methyl-CPG-binding domain 1 [Striga asiatica]|uniref:Methyl-CPG-binding domain 1 n=1 Tax=Striga asiatica TaxID=4170 RepID=A0A5A7RB97_STRAF|nr:methyl-CPG-binding domain 1 [Striga asiatica]